jgi:tetratricopeptide (TPR) repeat protein
MARFRPGLATARAVFASVLMVGTVAVVVAIQARRQLVEGERQPLPVVPPQPVTEVVPESRAPAAPQASEPPDPVRGAWLQGGATAAAALEDLSLGVGSDPAMLQMARLQVEALLAEGRVEDAVARCERLRQAVAAAPSLQSREPDVLEQQARARIMAGEVEMRQLERDLKASIEARRLMGTPVSGDAWATLGTLHKALGDCVEAVAAYEHAVPGVDAPTWIRLQRSEPWRVQTLALVAMDRADCLDLLDRSEAAREAAIRLAADLAVAFGDGHPLSRQAADLRDRLIDEGGQG